MAKPPAPTSVPSTAPVAADGGAANPTQANQLAGRLVLMPNSLDLGCPQTVDLSHVMPRGALLRASRLSHWVVENAKSARAFLKRVDAVCPLALPLQSVSITELPRPAKGGQTGKAAATELWKPLLAPALAGDDLGLLSEAGLPAVADPGAELVAAAHALGVLVEPWSGPSSLMLALAASGLGGQHFSFVGYLPQDGSARASRIKALEQASGHLGQTILAIETPYRNAALLRALQDNLAPRTRLAVACGISLPAGWVRSEPVARWRAQAEPRMTDDAAAKWPAVFLWRA
jgi:16S rRNA (cytidine1402-2'-O)-methyltransferase